MTTSVAQRLADCPDDVRAAVIADLSPDAAAALPFNWRFWARPDQLPPPGDWRIWLLLAGRGAGKTRSASEWVRDQIETGRRRSIGIIGPTADTLRRDVVQGSSGLLAIAPPWSQPSHEPSQRRIVWPNGAVAHLLSSEEPDRIRGVNLDSFYGDELTSWSNPEACWDNLQFALRITGPKGDSPAGVISTTPKRHTLLRSILADPSTVVTRAKMIDNAANLDARTIEYLQRKFGGTTIGRQELDGELLDDVDGALWTRAVLDECRIATLPEMKRVVIGIDPSGGSNRSNDETGIVACGLGVDGRGYVIADASGRYTPDGWGRAAVGLYHALRADRIICEANFGGAMAEATIRNVDRNVPVRMVTASRGKMVRAEPVSALYEQRRVSHVANLPTLEDQLCGWAPGSPGSPDRLDALVWALTELMVERQPQPTRWVNFNIFDRGGGICSIGQR